MKKFIYAFLVIMFCFIIMSMSKKQVHYEFGKEDFILYNKKTKVSLELNETVEEIKKKIGEPNEIKRVKPNEELYDLIYDNVLVQYAESDKKAYWIRAITPDFQTRRGIKVGDSIDKFYELYTEDEISDFGKFGNSDERYICVKLLLQRVGWQQPIFELFFIHDGNIVTKLELQYSSW